MTITVPITVPQLVVEVRKLAEAEPERMAQCQYTRIGDDGRSYPECIIGQALFNLGVPITDLQAWEGNSVGDIIDQAAFIEERQRSPRPFALVEVDWLTIVQEYQDHGKAWFNAVVKADLEVDF